MRRVLFARAPVLELCFFVSVRRESGHTLTQHRRRQEQHHKRLHKEAPPPALQNDRRWRGDGACCLMRKDVLMVRGGRLDLSPLLCRSKKGANAPCRSPDPEEGVCMKRNRSHTHTHDKNNTGFRVTRHIYNTCILYLLTLGSTSPRTSSVAEREMLVFCLFSVVHLLHRNTL